MEPLMLFLTIAAAISFIFIAGFLLFADCDLSLTFNTVFGRPVSVFKGKVVWITGASSGLGEAMAYELASVGAKLILSARNTERLVQVKEKCLDTSQGILKREDILVLPFNITNCDVHQEKFNNALGHFQQIDALINNAGQSQVGSCEKTSIHVYRELFDINYFGPVSLTKLVLRHFKERQNGQILFISSLGGKSSVAKVMDLMTSKRGVVGCSMASQFLRKTLIFMIFCCLDPMGSPGVAAYCSTKHALQGFHGCARMEHGIDNIKVTVVCPGLFVSEITSRLMTETVGEVHKDVINCDVLMPTSRCAHLSLVAAANNSNEAWISHQPLLFFMYMYQYMPDIATFVFSIICTKELVSESVQARFPKTVPAWKPLFRRN